MIELENKIKEAFEHILKLNNEWFITVDSVDSYINLEKLFEDPRKYKDTAGPLGVDIELVAFKNGEWQTSSSGFKYKPLFDDSVEIRQKISFIHYVDDGLFAEYKLEDVVNTLYKVLEHRG